MLCLPATFRTTFPDPRGPEQSFVEEQQQKPIRLCWHLSDSPQVSECPIRSPAARPGAHTGPHARGALGPTFLRASTAPGAQLSPHKPGLILRAQWDRRHFGRQHRYLRDVGFIPGQLYCSTHGVSQHFKSLYMIGKDQSYGSMRSPLLWVKVTAPPRAECKQWTGSLLLGSGDPGRLCRFVGLQGSTIPQPSTEDDSRPAAKSHMATYHPLRPPWTSPSGEGSLPTAQRWRTPQRKRITKLMIARLLVKFDSEKFTTTHQDGPFKADLYFKKSLGWLI